MQDKAGGATEGDEGLPRVARRTDQLRVSLWKHVLVKRRAPKATVCELVSPALFISILVLGYYLSDPAQFPAAIYAAIRLDIGPLLELVIGFTQVVAAPDAFSGSSLVQQPNSSSIDLIGVRDSVGPLLEGPLPVLDLPLFAGVSQAAAAALSEDNYRQLRELDAYGALFGNILTLGTLHLAPVSAAAAAAVSVGASLSDRLDDFHTFVTRTANISVLRHADEASALAFLAGSAERRASAWSLIVFNALSPRAVNASIRLNYTTVPNTNLITNQIARGLDPSYQQYTTSGFLTLQRLVDAYAFELAAEHGALRVPPPTQEALLTPFPTAAYEQNPFYLAVQFLLPLILTMCQLFPVALLIKSIVEEKELRLKQTMRIMGLSHGVHTAAWLISAVSLFCLNALLAALVATFFLPNTAFWVLFLFIFLFCLASIAFAFLLSVFFSNAILSAVFGPVVFFAMVLPKYLFFGSNRYERTNDKVLASLLSPTAFAFGAEVLGDYEYAAVGVSPANWADGDYSFALSLFMLALDAVLYLLLALYLERVLPSKYGQRLHPLFFLFPSFWRPPADPDLSAPRAQAPVGPAFEPVPAALAGGPAVEIVNLTKTYGSGRLKKTAVDGLNLSFYPGQISCLLGHNGAGKTTTLSVLTGLFPPSSGDCYVFGHSIRKAAGRVYEMMGICPQHDVLWHTLTVLEHVETYAALKGVPRAAVRREAMAMVQSVGLTDKAHARAHALSGGMKRKLSVACSLIGGSRCVLLDEPTSGMDPASRRSLWELLKSSTAGRVLVLTTHYMDEADVLADRIAVMSTGKLRCVGSSLFLKSRFGLGYTLTMVRENDACDAERVTEAVRAHVPAAEILSQHGGELSYRLPFSASASFGPLLFKIHEAQGELGIGGYGMSVTSMEEVFLRLSQGQAAVVQPAPGADVEMGSTARGSTRPTTPDAVTIGIPAGLLPKSPEGAKRLSRIAQVHDEALIKFTKPLGGAAPLRVDRGPATKRKQLAVLLRKRWHVAKRDVKGFLTQQVLPVVLIALVLLILTIRDPRVGPAIRLDASLYTIGSQAVQRTQFVHNVPLNHPIMARLNASALSFYPVEGNSADISRYLLDTYNDHDRDLRIGSLAMPDMLSVNITAALSSFEEWRGAMGGNATGAAGTGAAADVGAAALRSLLRCDALLRSPVGGLPYSLNLTQPVIDGLRNATGAASALLDGINITLSNQLATGGAGAPPIDASLLFNNTAICGSNGPARQLATFVAQPLFIQRFTLGLLVMSLDNFLEQLPAGSGADLAALLEDDTLQADLLEALPGISEALDCLCADGGTGVVQCAISSDLGVAGISASIERLPSLQTLLLALEGSFEEPIPLRALAQVGLELAVAFQPEATGTNVAALEAAFDTGCAALTASQPNASLATISWQTIYAASGETLPPPPPSAEPLTINGESPSAFALELTQSVLPVLLARASASAFPLSVNLPPLLEALSGPQLATLDLFGVSGLIQSLANGTEVELDQLATTYFYIRDFVSPDPVLVFPVDGVQLLSIAVSGMGVRLGSLLLSEDRIVIDGFRLEAQGALLQASGDQLGPVIPLSLGVDTLTFDAQGFSAVGINFAANPIASGSLPDMAVSATDDLNLDRVTAIAELPVTMNILFNASSPHANAAMLGEVSAAAWRAVHELAPDAASDDDEPLVYAFYNHPLPLTAGQSAQIRVILAFLAGIFVLVPFCYIPAAVAALVVKERVSKAKHLQLVSGTDPYIYWLAHFLWDMAQYTLVAVATMLVFAAYAEPAFVGNGAQGLASFLVVWLYGLAAIPLAYCYTWLFTSHATAQIGIIIFNLVTGFVMVIAHQVMQVLPNTRDADAVLVNVYRLFPPFNFGQAILALTQDWYIAELLDMPHVPFNSAEVVRALYLLPLECLLFCTILMAIEHSYTTHAILLRLTRAVCGGETLGCAFRAKVACGVTSALALLLVVIGAAGLGAVGGGDEVQSALNFDGGATDAPPPPPPAEANTARSAILLAIGMLLLVAAVASCILYERRLRRRGGTMEEAAFRALQQAEGPSFQEEADVEAERRAVDALVGPTGSGPAIASAGAVIVHRLNKVFPARGKAAPKVAVVDLSLRIADGECFGFLGVNGAGKTTSISMLTGEFLPTKGSAWIGGHNVATRLKLVREQLGYCPQFDPLLELMTARELLTMFAQLKNLPPADVAPTVQSLIDRVTLTPYADRVCGSYSGGNKRKLSLAIALIGSPRVVFLDEPSSGMDPASRRHMWDVITAERNRCAVVLTTHSMEECEALCTRLGIMAGGRFRCLGGQQHLKSKYGRGYTLELRVEPAKHDDAASGVRQLFPSAVLLEEDASKFKFELPAASVKLHEIFDRMEKARGELGVLDYSASQPTLESLFLSIVGPARRAVGGRTAPPEQPGTQPKPFQ